MMEKVRRSTSDPSDRSSGIMYKLLRVADYENVSHVRSDNGAVNTNSGDHCIVGLQQILLIEEFENIILIGGRSSSLHKTEHSTIAAHIS